MSHPSPFESDPPEFIPPPPTAEELVDKSRHEALHALLVRLSAALARRP